MLRKKNSFFMFCFSMIPGAAHMYMGFMKQGLSIMIVLFVNIFLCAFLRMEVLGLVLPVLWFYAFFDAYNKRALSEEEFQALEDKPIFDFNGKDEVIRIFMGKQRMVVAGILIFMGVYMLWNYMTSWIYFVLPDRLYYNGILQIPKIIFALFIIYVGVRLIRGKKQEMDQIEKRDEDGTKK